jgi:hypothetical protein
MYGVGIQAGFLTKLVLVYPAGRVYGIERECDAAMVGITASIINGQGLYKIGDVGVGEPVGFI